MTITIRYRGLDDKWIDTCKDCVWQNGTKIHGPPCDDICATHPTGYVLNQGRFADAPHYPVPAINDAWLVNPIWERWAADAD